VQGSRNLKINYKLRETTGLNAGEASQKMRAAGKTVHKNAAHPKICGRFGGRGRAACYIFPARCK